MVIEDPARVLWPSGLVRKVPGLLAVAPEPADVAIVTVFLPEGGIDMAGGVQRRDELIPVIRGPVRKLFRTCQFETYALERVRQLSHDVSSFD